MDINAIKQRIEALSRMTKENGCSEAEALAAATKLRALLDEHGLTMADIDDYRSGKRDAKIGTQSWNNGKARLHEVNYCANAIATYFDCKVWNSPAMQNGKPIKVLKYLGFETDVMAALAMTQFVVLAMEQEWTGYWAQKRNETHVHGRMMRTSFLRGMANRISERLKEMKEAQRKAPASTGNALVVVKNQLVTEELAKMGLGLRTRYSSYRPQSGAYYAGRAAGDRVGLSQNNVGESKKLA